jgi:SAM-dependent methyltransferase
MGWQERRNASKMQRGDLMDPFDIIWNILRKILSNNIYLLLKKSPIGRRPYDYYAIPTYTDIFNSYRSALGDFKGKKVLEVGPGEQFYTSCYFLSAGAESVTLVDPAINDTSFQVCETHARRFEEQNKGPAVSHLQKIGWFRSLDAIPQAKNGAYDIICSNFVLEHFKDLNDYFLNVKRLLHPDGRCFNYVDLSDHAYHFFDGRKSTKWIYRARMLYHLRYSDHMYHAITDKRIWVNRLLLPTYIALANKYGFKILAINKLRYHKTKIHQDILENNPAASEEDLFVTHFSLLLSK